MSSIYDLSRGYKGFKGLAIMRKIKDCRNTARLLRATYSNYDRMDPDVMNANERANELERKATNLEKQMNSRK